MSEQARYPSSDMRLQVRQITFQAERINSYELVHPDGLELPPFTAGAHIDFHFRDGSVRQYSLCNDPAERHRYLIAVLREDEGVEPRWFSFFFFSQFACRRALG